jgi:hypothetical protein
MEQRLAAVEETDAGAGGQRENRHAVDTTRHDTTPLSTTSTTTTNTHVPTASAPSPRQHADQDLPDAIAEDGVSAKEAGVPYISQQSQQPPPKSTSVLTVIQFTPDGVHTQVS